MPSRDLLWILTDPVVSRNDLNQFRDVWLASAARHAKHATSPPDISHGPMRALHADSSNSKGSTLTEDCSMDSDSHKRRLSQAFTVNDIQGAIPSSQRIKLDPAGTAYPRCASAFIPQEGHWQEGFSPMPLYGSLIDRMATRVPAPSVQADIEGLKNMIRPIDGASLMTGDYKPDFKKSFIYTLPLRFTPTEVEHPGYAARVVRKEFFLAVDTADSSFWFYGEDFQQIKVDPVTKEMSVHQWPVNGPHRGRRWLPRGDIPHVGNTACLRYGDGGAVELERWPFQCDLPFSAPAWNWKENRKSMSATISIPRILARAANDVTAKQQCDGNLGLAVPGWRSPWDDVDEADRVSFWDVLNDGTDYVESVQMTDGDLTEMSATIRMLLPDSTKKAVADDRVRSFVYFGKGSPCGISFDDGTMLLPNFSDPMCIFPDPVITNQYQRWSLELVSICLLEPLTANPNHDTIKNDEWNVKRIPMIQPPECRDDGTVIFNTREGIRTMFDSCCACTVLPRRVLLQIWADWFDQDPDVYPGDDKKSTILWHAGQRDRFANHDITFQFLDAQGKMYSIRGSAQDFLSAPWGDRSADWTYSMFQDTPDKQDIPVQHWTLGMNFFWTFMMRMEAKYPGNRPDPAKANPTLQFAPQRIVQDGAKVAGPWDLKLHSDLPPRLQNALRRYDGTELHPGDG